MDMHLTRPFAPNSNMSKSPSIYEQSLNNLGPRIVQLGKKMDAGFSLHDTLCLSRKFAIVHGPSISYVVLLILLHSSSYAVSNLWVSYWVALWAMMQPVRF